GLTIFLGLAAPVNAHHAPGHECRYENFKLLCHWSGGGSSQAVEATSLPPPPPGGPWLRTGTDAELGSCWYFSPYPPGLNTSDPVGHQAALAIVASRPACTGEDLFAQAWEVFRSFPLTAPQPTLQPPVGITGLDSYLSVPPPAPIEWSGTLPSGVGAQVRAEVAAVEVDWGDGTTGVLPLEALQPYPQGSATHLYDLKTCPPEYRSTHPAGVLCHPSLEAYPVTLTYRWSGSFRTGARWTALGVLERSLTVTYDVDEVVGVLER
ncbi:MAG: hypothetical protein M3N51_03505, partial [Actinomycetota bacterium]|nr:hypothetical protein [Actinomycetota bacterium]